MIFKLSDKTIKYSDNKKRFFDAETSEAFFSIYESIDNPEYFADSQYVCGSSDKIDGNKYFSANADFSDIAVNGVTDESSFFLILYNIFRYRILFLNGVAAHGAVVIYKNEGIMFCGFSGAGKSTQANLWKKYLGTEVLNYDRPAILRENDVYYVSGTPWSGKESCFINKQVPLKAIVFIEKRPYNSVERIKYAEAYTKLLYNFMIDPLNDETYELYEKNITDICGSIPVYELCCTKTVEAVKTLLKELYGDKESENIKEEIVMYKRKPDFMLKNVADELILIPRGAHSIQFNATVLMNETSAFIWNSIEEADTAEHIVDKLLEEYDVDRETAEKDIAAVLQDMISSGIVDEVSE